MSSRSDSSELRRRLRRAFVWVAAGLLLAAAACSPGGTPPEGGAQDTALVEREFRSLAREYVEKTGSRAVSAEEVLERVKKGERVLFIDVRTPEEQEVSVLPGALTVHLAEIRKAAAELRAKLGAGDFVVTYCTAGYRSGLAASELEKVLGRPVYNLEGGIIAWHNSGGPLVTPDGRPTRRVHPYGEEWARYVIPPEDAALGAGDTTGGEEAVEGGSRSDAAGGRGTTTRGSGREEANSGSPKGSPR